MVGHRDDGIFFAIIGRNHALVAANFSHGTVPYVGNGFLQTRTKLRYVKDMKNIHMLLDVRSRSLSFFCFRAIPNALSHFDFIFDFVEDGR